MNSLDDINSQKVKIQPMPSKLPVYLKNNKTAISLFQYATHILQNKKTTTINEIEQIVKDHMVSDIDKYGDSHVLVSLIKLPLNTRTLMIITHFTK